MLGPRGDGSPRNVNLVAAAGVDLQQSLPGTVDPSPEMTTAPSPVAPEPLETSPARGPPRLPPLVPPSGASQVHPATAVEGGGGGGVEGIGWERPPPVPVDTDAANSEVCTWAARDETLSQGNME